MRTSPLSTRHPAHRRTRPAAQQELFAPTNPYGCFFCGAEQETYFNGRFCNRAHWLKYLSLFKPDEYRKIMYAKR